MSSHQYYYSLLCCADRYAGMATCDDYINLRGSLANNTGTDSLSPFIEQFRNGCVEGPEQLPVEKLLRWLGYIQGVLIERSMTSVEIERNWTRPLFRPLEFPNE